MIKDNIIMYEDLKLYVISSLTLLFTTFEFDAGLENVLVFTTIIYTMVRIYNEITRNRKK